MPIVIEQLCIKSFHVEEDGESWTAKQGDSYTTTIPRPDETHVRVLSNYWVWVPKEHFVPLEKGK